MIAKTPLVAARLVPVRSRLAEAAMPDCRSRSRRDAVQESSLRRRMVGGPTVWGPPTPTLSLLPESAALRSVSYSATDVTHCSLATSAGTAASIRSVPAGVVTRIVAGSGPFRLNSSMNTLPCSCRARVVPSASSTVMADALSGTTPATSIVSGLGSALEQSSLCAAPVVTASLVVKLPPCQPLESTRHTPSALGIKYPGVTLRPSLAPVGPVTGRRCQRQARGGSTLTSGYGPLLLARVERRRGSTRAEPGSLLRRARPPGCLRGVPRRAVRAA